MLSKNHIAVLTVILAAGLTFLADCGGFATAQPVSLGPSFRDCVDCPEMVAIPAGSFIMGPQPGEEERADLRGQVRGRADPQHRVNIAAFAAGKYDVTRDEYARFVSETNRPDPDKCFTLPTTGNFTATNGDDFVETNGANWRNPGFTQTGRDPAVCVSWDDAQAYAAWLSKTSGKPYRLLSESEWEYAARAGTVTSRYWGESTVDQCLYANGADLTVKTKYPNLEVANCRDGYLYTSPVGSFRPNAFGLYDMLGNVLQWTSDCWNKSYVGAPSDGGAWTTGDCHVRTSRGGSWLAAPSVIRSAYRLSHASDYRISRYGFRVARAL